ncbi:hypothetical protein AAVH_07608 [Aphelenchoides avenae]|nr:hypothetical protein AAVH_07608 [Aphelenchus avenae]
MLYAIRVEPLRRDVTRKEVEDLLRDFGTIHRVSIHRASLVPRYNRISKQRDILDPTKHPITNQYYAVVENVKMGLMVVHRSLRVRQHVLNYGRRA